MEQIEEMEAGVDMYRVQYEGRSGPAPPARMECKLSATSSRAALVTAAGVATAGSSGAATSPPPAAAAGLPLITNGGVTAWLWP
jgi:hypothetical protein